MKTLTPLLISLVAVTACSPVSPQAQSKPDPRLGTVVFETSAQIFGRNQPYLGPLSGGHVLRSRSMVNTNQAGDTFALITIDSSRPFGTDETRAAETVLKKISSAGLVTTLTPPVLGSDTLPANSFLRFAGDGVSPYLVDVMPEDNARGRYVQLALSAGNEWKYVAFLRADRALNDFTEQWDNNEDQVRVLTPSAIVIQHGNTLARFDGTVWSSVATDSKATELRLGAATETSVRVYWTTLTNELKTDVLNADGTWRGAVVSVTAPDPLKLKGVFGFAGTVDDFLINTSVMAKTVNVYRFTNGAWSLLVNRPPLSAELEGKAYLISGGAVATATFVDARGALFGLQAGTPTTELGTIPGFQLGSLFITCPVDCTLREGFPVALAPECAVCVPRSIRVVWWNVTPDQTKLNLLLLDNTQDATERFYVKSVSLPVTVEDITQSL